MIKIEIITRKSVADMNLERQYRAELPDDATAEQISAASNENSRTEIQITDAAKDITNELVSQESIPTIGGWKK